MKASLRTLLSGIIDYAGLFPPAQLSLDESIRNYARYRKEAESWMLGRFICPATRLKEVAPLMPELFGRDETLPISALGRGGANAEEFIIGFGRDMQAAVEFEQEFASQARIEVLETRLPPTSDVRFDFDAERIALFLESTPGADWRKSIATAISFARATDHHCGFKLRTGGVEAKAFPPSEQIAFAIIACRDNEVPLKFTAGLHHPIRRFDASVDTTMHGFINVFVAGVLAHTANLTEAQLVEILDDQSVNSFTFDDAAMRWKNQQATTQQIESVRQNSIISFGSCSFDEPRDDLRALGWL